MNLHRQIEKALNRLIVRVKAEVSECAYFDPIPEKLKLNNSYLYCGTVDMVVTLPFASLKPDKISFDLIVYTPSGQSNASCILGCGNKTELLELLSNKDFIASIQQKIPEMANELKVDRFE